MNIDKKALIGFITEIEASRERAKGETRHQSDIFKKAKEKGFDTKAMRKVLQRRAMSEADRDSMDLAIESYERAMGSLAAATEAVEEGRMSAREAAEHFGVPRGALGTVTRGAKNGISEPPHDPETGEINDADGNGKDAIRVPADDDGLHEGCRSSNDGGGEAVRLRDGHEEGGREGDQVEEAPLDDLAIPPFLRRVQG